MVAMGKAGSLDEEDVQRAAEGRAPSMHGRGNSKVGEGRMEILEATPAKVTIQLDFIRRLLVITLLSLPLPLRAVPRM